MCKKYARDRKTSYIESKCWNGIHFYSIIEYTFLVNITIFRLCRISWWIDDKTDRLHSHLAVSKHYSTFKYCCF